MGNDRKAYDSWREAASLPLNWYAERQVARLGTKLDLPYDAETVFLPSTHENPRLRRPGAAGVAAERK